MAEDWEVKLIRDQRFKQMAPDRQKVVYQEARNRYGGQGSQPAQPQDPQLRSAQLEQDLPQRDSYTRQLVEDAPREMLTNAQFGLGDRNPTIMEGLQHGINSNPLLNAMKGLGRLGGAAFEQAVGIPSDVGIAMNRGAREGGIAPGLGKDIMATLSGQRPAMPGDVLASSNVPGLSAPPAQALANLLPILMGLRSSGIRGPNVQDVPGMVARAPGQIMQTGKNVVQSGQQGMGKALDYFGLRSPKQMSTSPTVDELALLPKTSRQMYLGRAKAGIESQAESSLVRERDRLRAYGEDLADQINKAGSEVTLRARDDMARLMGKASPTWRKLVQEGLDAADDVPISHLEIEQELAKKFGGDATSVARALDEISVNRPSRTSIDPLMGTQVQPYSAKEVWSRLNQERLGMGMSKRSGDVLYGEKEFFKDSVVEALTNILHRRGVDLRAANNFWAPYAQLRNSVFRAIKPFGHGEFQVESGSRMFQGAAKGKAKVAEVSALERETGQDYTSQLKDLLQRQGEQKSKISTVQRTVKQGKSKQLIELKEKGLLAQEKAGQFSTRRKIAGAGALAATGAGGLGWLARLLTGKSE